MRYQVLLISLLALFSMQAKDKTDPHDQIEVIGHLPSTGGPIFRFVPAKHYSSFYLYAEHPAGNLTLIDVTKAANPAVLADVASTSSAGLLAVTGTAALVGDGQSSPAAPPVPQTIRIMDFSDPQHPAVHREFTGVTALSRDEHRGLIYIANAEGIWVLKQKQAEDPEVEKAYAHHVIYDH